MRAFVWTLAVVTCLALSSPPNGWAMLAPAVLPESPDSRPASSRETDRHAVQRALESKIVRERLTELGLSDAEIQRRVDKLDDAQLHQIAMQADKVNAGGDDQTTIITIGAITILILLLIYLIKKV